jgi:hypothetical protein
LNSNRWCSEGDNSHKSICSGVIDTISPEDFLSEVYSSYGVSPATATPAFSVYGIPRSIHPGFAAPFSQ